MHTPSIQNKVHTADEDSRVPAATDIFCEVKIGEAEKMAPGGQNYVMHALWHWYEGKHKKMNHSINLGEGRKKK